MACSFELTHCLGISCAFLARLKHIELKVTIKQIGNYTTQLFSVERTHSLFHWQEIVLVLWEIDFTAKDDRQLTFQLVYFVFRCEAKFFKVRLIVVSVKPANGVAPPRGTEIGCSRPQEK